MTISYRPTGDRHQLSKVNGRVLAWWSCAPILNLRHSQMNYPSTPETLNFVAQIGMQRSTKLTVAKVP